MLNGVERGDKYAFSTVFVTVVHQEVAIAVGSCGDRTVRGGCLSGKDV
ncbi:MAG: hypothetical protein IKO73_04545 [Bacteroidaceae bacterium]|nr:hypothetical protein [Bacteroidaceae bacterium]